jgi:hypothetical protein
VARIVCVHGIAQQVKGEETLGREWSAALRDGIRLAGAPSVSLSDADIRYAFYGNLFRQSGRTLGVGDPILTAQDTTEFEQELILAWWQAAAATDPGVISPDARSLVRAPRSLQAALRALSGSRFFSGLAERAMISHAVQVRRYFTEPEIRQAIQQTVSAVVDDDTRVIIGHSLGSVVAYEWLCANPSWPVRTLITLGSPLGVRGLIFDRLKPAPTSRPGHASPPQGHWPGPIQSWTNIADDGDIVALVKDLRPQFGDRMRCHIVHNGSKAHAIASYLTAPETGRAILAGLQRP